MVSLSRGICFFTADVENIALFTVILAVRAVKFCSNEGFISTLMATRVGKSSFVPAHSVNH